MRKQLAEKMIKLIDQDLQEIDVQLHKNDEQKTNLLIEKVELLRARKEIEEDLHGGQARGQER